MVIGFLMPKRFYWWYAPGAEAVCGYAMAWSRGLPEVMADVDWPAPSECGFTDLLACDMLLWG